MRENVQNVNQKTRREENLEDNIEIRVTDSECARARTTLICPSTGSGGDFCEYGDKLTI